jgi:hypothetical protein
MGNTTGAGGTIPMSILFLSVVGVCFCVVVVFGIMIISAIFDTLQ